MWGLLKRMPFNMGVFGYYFECNKDHKMERDYSVQPIMVVKAGI